MDNPPSQKKGLGPLAWLGIGCGGLIVLTIIGLVIFSVMFGGQIKEFAEEASKNPTRLAATTAVTISAGQLEIIAEDNENKRYTVREKQTGKLTTMYWNEKTKTVVTIPGDFSAIPAEAAPTSPAEPSSPTEAAPTAPSAGGVGAGAGQ